MGEKDKRLKVAAPEAKRSVTQAELASLQLAEANLQAAAARLETAQLLAQAAGNARAQAWAALEPTYGKPGHQVYVDLAGPMPGRLQVLPKGTKPKDP